ncbi:hypothetical protein TREMEDRAFT_59938 [Tremella mesenterica DSM 1558]|uniref:uncharacterized protein n=1 Tax=Tremella mesenterica (strain ATCC 24925 / CBS 8224 / DSM 1558 / NBRC 9311 / NRRL Y-6157 / RJB 2259-6 / UBC 559-6) TaxID=578456 RepID=UPI0003F49AC5|nr:uncharacterized protein TREMEDRAFT_59938 [Tremella mesenterica DSM 1558]EIW70995.1 hypothetical protein TREMEDRAFT_59938 [Tremella mesenterica DSM 1558]
MSEIHNQPKSSSGPIYSKDPRNNLSSRETFGEKAIHANYEEICFVVQSFLSCFDIFNGTTKSDFDPVYHLSDWSNRHSSLLHPGYKGSQTSGELPSGMFAAAPQLSPVFMVDQDSLPTSSNNLSQAKPDEAYKPSVTSTEHVKITVKTDIHDQLSDLIKKHGSITTPFTTSQDM